MNEALFSDVFVRRTANIKLEKLLLILSQQQGTTKHFWHPLGFVTFSADKQQELIWPNNRAQDGTKKDRSCQQLAPTNCTKARTLANWARRILQKHLIIQRRWD